MLTLQPENPLARAHLARAEAANGELDDARREIIRLNYPNMDCTPAPSGCQNRFTLTGTGHLLYRRDQALLAIVRGAEHKVADIPIQRHDNPIRRQLLAMPDNAWGGWGGRGYFAGDDCLVARLSRRRARGSTKDLFTSGNSMKRIAFAISFITAKRFQYIRSIFTGDSFPNGRSKPHNGAKHCDRIMYFRSAPIRSGFEFGSCQGSQD